MQNKNEIATQPQVFLEVFCLVMEEKAKKLEKSYHLGVANRLSSLYTVRQ